MNMKPSPQMMTTLKRINRSFSVEVVSSMQRRSTSNSLQLEFLSMIIRHVGVHEKSCHFKTHAH